MPPPDPHPIDVPAIVAMARGLRQLLDSASWQPADVHDRLNLLAERLNGSLYRGLDGSSWDIEASKLSLDIKERLHQLWRAVSGFAVVDGLRYPAQRRAFLAVLDGVSNSVAAQPTEDVALVAASLTKEDRTILVVLRRVREPLSNGKIAIEAARLRREDRSILPISERTIRSRIRGLEAAGLIARPPRTQKKGVHITQLGVTVLDACRKLAG